MTNQTLKKYIPCIAIILIAGAGSFYAGTQYERSKATTSDRGNFAMMSPEARQARMVNGGSTNGQRSGMMRTANGGIVAGEIIAKDATSITVSLRDGGSKIVFLSDTTKVTKPVDGSVADLAVGAQVTTMGTANTDGSILAQSIQLRNDTPQNKN